MRVRAQRVFLSDASENLWGFPLIIEDIRTGKQHLVIGKKCFDERDDDEDMMPWSGDLDDYLGVVVLYDDEKDSLEAFYDTLDRGLYKSEFPRVVTKADQKLRKKSEAAERRRLKRRQAIDGSPAPYDPSEMQQLATASTIKAIVAMNDSERSHDES